MDVNKGPLRKAQENICAYKMEEQIETRLSDGFSALKVQEVQSAVIAGMGGNQKLSILKLYVIPHFRFYSVFLSALLWRPDFHHRIVFSVLFNHVFLYKEKTLLQKERRNKIGNVE